MSKIWYHKTTGEGVVFELMAMSEFIIKEQANDTL